MNYRILQWFPFILNKKQFHPKEIVLQNEGVVVLGHLQMWDKHGTVFEYNVTVLTVEWVSLFETVKTLSHFVQIKFKISIVQFPNSISKHLRVVFFSSRVAFLVSFLFLSLNAQLTWLLFFFWGEVNFPVFTLGRWNHCLPEKSINLQCVR